VANAANFYISQVIRVARICTGAILSIIDMPNGFHERMLRLKFSKMMKKHSNLFTRLGYCNKRKLYFFHQTTLLGYFLS